jgi:hypothetical protein
MTRSIVGLAALTTLLVFAAHGARAQAVTSWPRVGARLVRIEEATSRVVARGTGT